MICIMKIADHVCDCVTVYLVEYYCKVYEMCLVIFFGGRGSHLVVLSCYFYFFAQFSLLTGIQYPYAMLEMELMQNKWSPHCSVLLLCAF